MTNLLHTKCVRNKTLLPFSVIHAASQGDEAAICCILKHYEGYIRRLATRCFYDAAGNLYYFVDDRFFRGAFGQASGPKRVSAAV